MSVIEYPAKSFHKLTRKQLITLAIALEEQRDRAIAKSEELPQAVLDHINQRSEYVQAAPFLTTTPTTTAGRDTWRRAGNWRRASATRCPTR